MTFRPEQDDGGGVRLGQLLSLPVLARARPQVVHGDHLLDKQVRWVHTSEIYDIGPLLKGGEVLLTTGLGLVGSSSEQLRAYVADLTDRSVTALVLELGRTFPAVPADLLDEARRRDLALIALHGVVPFIDVTQTVHSLLIEQEVASLRRAERVNAELTDCLLSGRGLPPLLNRVAALAGCPALLLAADGHVVAGSDDGAGPPDIHTAVTKRAVEVFGVEWGHLVLLGDETANRSAVLDRGVVAVALELVRTAAVAPARAQAGRELLRDIAMNRFGSASELSARAAGVGLVVGRSDQLVAACLRVEPDADLRPVVNAAAEAARHTFRRSLVAEIDDEVLVAGSLPAPDNRALRDLLGQFVDVVKRELAATTRPQTVALTAGPPVFDVPALVGAVQTSREASAIARHIGSHRPVLLSADLGVERLMCRLVDDPELERFVDDQLGPLLDHDARYGRDLARTLDTYLAHGLSKTHTAAALGIRRQTLYARLAKIQTLLGDIDLDQRERRTALDLALVAWRLRTTAATHQQTRRQH